MEKLREEFDKTKNPYEKRIGNYIFSLNPKTIPAGKTLKGCMEEITKKAKKQAVGNVAMVEDYEVYGWAAEYFGLIPTEAKAVSVEPEKRKDAFDRMDFQLEDLL